MVAASKIGHAGTSKKKESAQAARPALPEGTLEGTTTAAEHEPQLRPIDHRKESHAFVLQGLVGTPTPQEQIIKPVFFFPDPFRGGDNICVLCEGYKWADNTYKSKVPVNTNFRAAALAIFESAKDEEPWYGIEQEYTLL